MKDILCKDLEIGDLVYMACDEGFEDQDTIGIVTDIGFNYYGYAIYIGISSGRRSTDQDIDYGCVKDDSCVLLERDFRW